MSFFVAGVSWASFDGECRKKFKVHGKKKKKKPLMLSVSTKGLFPSLQEVSFQMSTF